MQIGSGELTSYNIGGKRLRKPNINFPVRLNRTLMQLRGFPKFPYNITGLKKIKCNLILLLLLYKTLVLHTV